MQVPDIHSQEYRRYSKHRMLVKYLQPRLDDYMTAFRTHAFAAGWKCTVVSSSAARASRTYRVLTDSLGFDLHDPAQNLNIRIQVDVLSGIHNGAEVQAVRVHLLLRDDERQSKGDLEWFAPIVFSANLDFAEKLQTATDALQERHPDKIFQRLEHWVLP